MCDSGSELNIIKEGVVPTDLPIDKNRIVSLRGISNIPQRTLGEVTISIYGCPSSFHLVENDFKIPFSGILGCQFFDDASCSINYSTKELIVNNQSIPLNRKFEKTYQETIPSENINEIHSISTKEILTNDVTADDSSISSSTEDDSEPEVYDYYYATEDEKILVETTPFECNKNKCLDKLFQEEFEQVKNQTKIKPKESSEESGSENEENNTDQINFSLTVATEENDIDEETVEYMKEIGDKLLNDERMVTECYRTECETDTHDTVKSELSRDEKLKNLLRLDHLEETEKNRMEKLIFEYSNVFFIEGDPLVGTDLIEHRIPLTDDIPVVAKQYKLPYNLKTEVNRQVKQLLEKGIIKESESCYRSPVWLVPKKVGVSGQRTWRMVIDYRKLNEKSLADLYPLPCISTIFDQIGKAKYFTILDLASGYHQLKINEADAHKTAFATDFGLFQFVRMPFGLKNSPACFQRCIDKALVGLQGVTLFVFIDDIVIYSQTLEEHEIKFRELMERLVKYNLKVQLEKCEFLKSEVIYLGHSISKDGLRVDGKKIEAVKRFPRPKNVKNIRQFMGLANYYSKFIKDFAKMAKPLTRLLQKDVKFDWNLEAAKAFNSLKDCLCNAPVLQFPDFSLPFIITCDSSNFAIGGILSQGKIGEDRPVAYTSRMLRNAEKNYCIYEKEFLAILHSVETFRHYIYNTHFTIVTDHRPLLYIKGADCNTRVQKWRFKLSEYDYEVIYRPGKRNIAADALSRNVPEDSDNQENASLIVTTKDQTNVEKLLPQRPKRNVKPPERLTYNAQSKGKTELQIPTHVDVESEHNKENPIKKKKKYKPSNKKMEQINKETSDSENEVELPKRKKPRKLIISDEDHKENTDEIEDILLSPDYTVEVERKSRDITASSPNINFVKDLIQFSKDSTIYFIGPKGEPLDEGAKKLLENNKIEQRNKYTPGSIKKSLINKKYYFGLCLEESESNLLKLEKLEILFKKLKERLQELSLTSFSLARSSSITNVLWKDLLQVLRKAFADTDIQVTICSGTIKYVPYNERDEIFNRMHTSLQAGHKGVTKTFNKIRQYYYWEHLKEDIRKRIQFCLNCQLKKLVRVRTKQPMQITDTPANVFEKVSIDIVGPLPKTENGCQYILTMQCCLSKFCLAAPLIETTSASIADSFIRKCICIFGAPKYLLSDQGQNLISSLIKRVAKRFKIKKIQTSAYRPSSNGALERSHIVLAEYLKQYIQNEKEWDSYLDLAMFSYNTSIHEGSKFSPFELVFGRLARLPSGEGLTEGEQISTYDDFFSGSSFSIN